MDDRDLELLALISRGSSIRDAARTMGESPHAAYDRLRRARREFGVESTIQAVVLAVRLGLI
jgi:DNA-binding CsgD family transcriptional regulator